MLYHSTVYGAVLLVQEKKNMPNYMIYLII